MNALSSTVTLRGCLRRNESMAAHTSWGTGGKADRFYLPADLDDLADYITGRPANEPIVWLGLGSNLLVRDGGIPGSVIQIYGVLDELRVIDRRTLRVEAGVACAKVAKESVRAGLAGAEFLAGIPGSMGGALAMNAGAFGGETWDLVNRVETLDRQGRRRVREAGEFQVGYRSVTGTAGEWFTAAVLDLQPDADKQGRQRIKRLLERRASTQPTGQRSCGSVFRNPPDDFAARLIEASGLKGKSLGHASVSDKHANFIVHDGNAGAAEIEALIGQIRERVARDHGVWLEPEVKIVGEPGTDDVARPPRQSLG